MSEDRLRTFSRAFKLKENSVDSIPNSRVLARVSGRYGSVGPGRPATAAALVWCGRS
jgi:hypothetical protein